MKYLLTCSLIPFITSQSIVQSVNYQRRIDFKTFGRDSINLSLNDQYYLIEDSCAQIIRYGHLKIRDRIFYGPFKDVSKENPALVVSEGNYTADGFKNGEFISHYLNGNLQSKGNFKANKYDGKWELYYEDGKPELTFEAINNDIKIIDAWQPDGKKTVDNGNGVYQANMDQYYWKGKLAGGKPDGTWKFILTSDITETPIVSEYFKKGLFRKGNMPTGDYTDSSRIVLVSPGLIPFTNAEKLQISLIACNGAGIKHIVNAQYKYGLDGYSSAIARAITSYLSNIDIKSINNSLTIEGEIAEDGSLDKLHCTDAFRPDLASGLIHRLYTLPFLQPATADNKPIREKFIIKFDFGNGVYKFNYQFLPILPNK